MKILLLLSVLFIASCHRSPWQHAFIRNGNDRYDLAKLIYPPSSDTQGIELEITRLGQEIQAYINVRHFKLPKNENDAQTTTVVISTHSATKAFVIPLLEGGERARLTAACLEYLIQNLELKTAVTLSSGHFSETVDASNFNLHYDAFMRKPSVIQPRSLIDFEPFK